MQNYGVLLMYVVLIFGFIYFMSIRPQQKQQRARQAMLSSLRTKDKVLTVGGIYGKINKVKDNSVTLQIAEKVEIEVAKSGIASVENRKIEDEDPKAKKANKVKEEDSKAKNEAGETNNTVEESK